MNFIRQLPLAKKIRALTMLTTSVALVLVGIAMLAFESYAFYHTRVDTLKAVAAIVGSNSSAAVVFHDADSAKEILGSLSAKASIIRARALYGGCDGTVIAIYDRVDKANQFHAPLAAEEGYGYSGGRIRMFHSIRYNGETIGTLYLESDINELYGPPRAIPGSRDCAVFPRGTSRRFDNFRTRLQDCDNPAHPGIGVDSEDDICRAKLFNPRGERIGRRIGASSRGLQSNALSDRIARC